MKLIGVQPDGGIILCGTFTTFSGIPVGNIVRLLPDGQVDAMFEAGSGFNGAPTDLEVQPDGKILVCGSFTQFDGSSLSCGLVRLNANGTRDNGFAPPPFGAAPIRSIDLRGDGRIVIGGGMGVTQPQQYGVCQLNQNGSPDPSFTTGPGFNGPVQHVRILSNGKVAAAGSFSAYAGTQRAGVAVLNASGSIDAGFDPGAGASGPIVLLEKAPNGGVYIGGNFTTYQNASAPDLIRISADGQVDEGFNIGAGPDGAPRALSTQSDGRIILGGDFSWFSGTYVGRPCRLEDSGAIDDGFGAGGGANFAIFDLAMQPDGKILIAGAFTTFNGQPVHSVARLINCVQQMWFADLDGDGLGGLNSAGLSCLPIPGHVANSSDCDDADPSILGPMTWFRDMDEDGAGDPNASVMDCSSPAGYVMDDSDCNDQDPNVAALSMWYQDDDGDGAGNASVPLAHCGPPSGFVANSIDCDDDDPAAQSIQNWYVDADGDGAGNPNSAISSCANILGWVLDNTDCDDNDRFIHPGSPCNDANPLTYFDVLGSDCVCAGLPCAMGPQLQIFPDAFGGQTTWQIRNANEVVVASGGPYTNGNTAVIEENLCLPQGCYRLLVFDSNGDGMCGTNGAGGYVLRTPPEHGGVPIIDNRNSGQFTNLSAINTANAPFGRFCLPLGHLKLQQQYAEPRQTLQFSSTIACMEDPAVSAQYGIGDQTDDGYRFWIFNPNKDYSVEKKQTHASPGNAGPTGPSKCSYLKLNYTTNPIPVSQRNKWLNVRVSSIVNGVAGPYGPAQRIWISTDTCVQLVDEPANSRHSCGVVRRFGAGQLNNKIWCTTVPGASQYRFRFSNAELGYQRSVTYLNAQCTFDWTTAVLIQGHTYSVVASAYVGGHWTTCTSACTVTINNSSAHSPISAPGEGAEPELVMWPNPNNGNKLHLSIDHLDTEIGQANVRIIDMLGREVRNETYVIEENQLSAMLRMDEAWPAGMYVVNVDLGDREFIQRLVLD